MATKALSSLPSVDRLLSCELATPLIEQFGRATVKTAFRRILDDARRAENQDVPDEATILALAGDLLAAESAPSLRPVYNLTGTVLHTNLGRASLPQGAIDRVAAVAAEPSNLEYDLTSGQRGDRDAHIERLLCEITGAEAATIVNNNAAAVLLVLNTFAEGREVIVSRGELVEIGGSFRIPEIMTRAGARLREVGATNRTHARDFADAVGPDTGLIMKVHTSNYEIRGFTHSPTETELAGIAAGARVPLVNDLGSGTLVDLTRFGLPPEPTVQAALTAGADIVTFSGDKLLGGPQAGMIVGKRALIERVKSNPMKRALRVDKMTLAAMFEVLKLYRDPASLPAHLPTLRWLSRPVEAIEQVARELLPALESALATHASVDIEPCHGQIGSGALPLEVLPGYALVLTPNQGTDSQLQDIAAALRTLPRPVIGRINDGKLYLDVRTIETPADFVANLESLKLT